MRSKARVFSLAVPYFHGCTAITVTTIDTKVIDEENFEIRQKLRQHSDNRAVYNWEFEQGKYLFQTSIIFPRGQLRNKLYSRYLGQRVQDVTCIISSSLNSWPYFVPVLRFFMTCATQNISESQHHDWGPSWTEHIPRLFMKDSYAKYKPKFIFTVIVVLKLPSQRAKPRAMCTKARTMERYSVKITHFIICILVGIFWNRLECINRHRKGCLL